MPEEGGSSICPLPRSPRARAIPGIAGAGGDFAMLVGEDGSNIVITRIEPSEHSAYPPGFHFGIIQDSVEAVHRKHDESPPQASPPGGSAAP